MALFSTRSSERSVRGALIVSIAQGSYRGTLLHGPHDYNLSPPPSTPSSLSAASYSVSPSLDLFLTPQSASKYPIPVQAWLGIPYAQSTAPPNRFALPRPLAKPASEEQRKEVQSAERPGNACPGTVAAGDGVRRMEGEDCLCLNIFKPASRGRRAEREEVWAAEQSGSGSERVQVQEQAQERKTSKRLLPVVVYIHGGAFNAGHALDRDMASFVSWAACPSPSVSSPDSASAGTEVLAVSFEYRIGALGFLPSGAAAREGRLNLGLRDQQLALQWVQDNIEAFGGDNSNVTLTGISAGAHSIGHHLLSYSTPTAAKDAPFHKVILESGSSLARATWHADHPRHEQQFTEFLEALGAPSSTPEKDIFPLLQTLPATQIVTASLKVFGRYNEPVCWAFQPCIDNTCHDDETGLFPPLITKPPIDQWREDEYLHVPTLLGFNTNEGSIFTPPHVETDSDFVRYFTEMIPTLTEEDVKAMRSMYPDPVRTFIDFNGSLLGSRANLKIENVDHSRNGRVPDGYGKQWRRLERAYGDYAYIAPVIMTADFLAKSHSHDATRPGSTSGVRPSTTGNRLSSRTGKEEDAAPIWLYHFAPLARPEWKLANHADEAVIVAHDMTELAPYPGLVHLAGEMCGAWARFAAFGDPNGHSHEGRAPWPRFQGLSAPSTTVHAQDEDTEAELDDEWEIIERPAGQIMLFGQGNDERAGGALRGIDTQPSQLNDVALERYQFWWDRIDLSQGYGERRGDTMTAKV